MNNIFTSYSNNLYIESIKNGINLQVNLNLDIINNIVNNYYNTSFHIKKYGLTKFIKTLINIYFNRITESDLRPILLLGFREIHKIYLETTINQNKLVNYLIQHYNNNKPEIILCEIISSLSYKNRDIYFLSKFKESITNLFIKQNERFNNLEPVYQINDSYYLLDVGDDNKTLHANVNNYYIPNNIDIKSISNKSSIQFNYIKNINAVNALLASVNKKLYNSNNITNDVDYLLLVKKYTMELKQDINLLKEKEINFNNFTRYIYENKTNNLIIPVNILLKKIFFLDDIKNIDVNTDLRTLDQEELDKHIITLLRSLSTEKLKDLLNINNLLLYIIELDKENKTNLFQDLLNTIDLTDTSYINYNEYSTLEYNEKLKLINKLNNIHINQLVYTYLKKKTLTTNIIDYNKLKAIIIN
jgi:hypothetical protein